MNRPGPTLSSRQIIQMLEGIASLRLRKSILETQYGKLTLGDIMEELRTAVVPYYRAHKRMRPVMNYKTGNSEFRSDAERFAWHLARDFTDPSQLEGLDSDNLSTRARSITEKDDTAAIDPGDRNRLSIMLLNFIEWMNGLFTQAKADYEGMGAMITEALDAFRVPGAAVGIVVDGEVVLAKGYGLRNLDEELPVTENTLFTIASLTKAFTAHLLGQLVDEGKIAWDDPVIRHLPEFRLKDMGITHRITIRDILAHHSGLPRHDMLWYGTKLKLEDVLPRLQHLDLSADLREKFQYNNLMYAVAGLVVERVTGQSWEEAAGARIFAPLGMQRTNISVTSIQESDDYSLPFREVDGAIKSIPFRNTDNNGPAGSINSSVADMVKWLGLQLSDGTLGGHQFLKSDILRSMHSPQAVFRSYPDNPDEALYSFAYGLGWQVGMYNGHYCVYHDGQIDGFTSFIIFLPNEKVGVVILANSDTHYPCLRSLSGAILDRILLGTERKGWILKGKAKNDEILNASKRDAVDGESTAGESNYPLDDYVGGFEHPGYGLAEVENRRNTLVLSYHSHSFVLLHKCYDSFVVKRGHDRMFAPFSFCSFSRGCSGEISGLEVPLEADVNAIVFTKKPDDELLATDYLVQFEGTFACDLFSLHVVLRNGRLVVLESNYSDESILHPVKKMLFRYKKDPNTTVCFTSGPDGKVSGILFTESCGSTFDLRKK